MRLVGAISALVVAIASTALVEVLPSFSADDHCRGEDLGNCPNHHFATSYLEARHKFRQRAEAAGAKLKARTVRLDERMGIDLTVDAAFLKGSKPDRVIVHMSGTHGVEGFAGSAVQAKLLEEFDGSNGHVQGPSVLMLHAVNPWGFHNRRRFTATNVDLNRNFLLDEAGWKKARARDPNEYKYETLNFLLNPVLTRWWQYFTHAPTSLPLVLPLFNDIKTAVVAGQYHNPKGLYYGGERLEPEWKAVLELFKEFVTSSSAVKKVFVVDVHSGLGDSGEDTLMVDDSQQALATSKYLPDSAARIQDPAAGGASSGYDCVLGSADLALVAPKGMDVVHVTQEFGTRPGPLVLAALIYENAVNFHTTPRTAAQLFGSNVLVNAFFVNTDTWKRSVLHRGTSVYHELVRNL